MGKSKHKLDPIYVRKKPADSTVPTQIKEGEILTDINHEKWRIGKCLGVGGFGVIHLISKDVSKPVPQDSAYAVKIEPHSSGPLFVERNFYIRVAKREQIEEWKKERNLDHLGMPHYITFGSHVYQNEKYRFLVLQRFGQDIWKLFTKYKKKFHIKTVLTLGIQIMDILEYIHSHGYIHVDVKGSNLLLGHGKGGEDKVFLLDYGLACRYVDSLGDHNEYNPDQRKAHDGTLEFTSRDAHVGAHSRRGDLEVLGYNMVQWLCGSLPWEHETDPELVAQEKNDSFENITKFLSKCFGDIEHPAVLNQYLNYVRNLEFESKPNYKYCKGLLSQGIIQAGYMNDSKLNITTPPVRQLKKRKSDDIENWPILKIRRLNLTKKEPSRKPCTVVQVCNRMTRQQTAANAVFELRSHERFDWVKVLQSNPEKMFTIKRNKEERTKRIKKKVVVISTVNLRKVKQDPWQSPTPAMLEVVKARKAAAEAMVTGTPGKRARSDSHSWHCSSPVLHAENTLTPAMEEVIRRRKALKSLEESTCFQPTQTATQARARRMATTVDWKSRLRKTSTPVPIRPIFRPHTRKYSLPDMNKNTPKKQVVRKKTRQRKIKVLATCQRTPRRKKLSSPKKRCEVKAPDVNLVPRLRAGQKNLPDSGQQIYN